MQTAPTKSPNRLEQTLLSFNLIRREKTPPLGGYCSLLALATQDKPMTLGQLCSTLGEVTYGGRSLETLERHGLLVIGLTTSGKKNYALTEKGKAEVARLIQGKFATEKS